MDNIITNGRDYVRKYFDVQNRAFPDCFMRDFEQFCAQFLCLNQIHKIVHRAALTLTVQWGLLGIILEQNLSQERWPIVHSPPVQTERAGGNCIYEETNAHTADPDVIHCLISLRSANISRLKFTQGEGQSRSVHVGQHKWP